MRLVLVLAVLLGGCGIVDPYTRSRGPDAEGLTVRKAVAATFKEARLSGTPMVSRVYEANLVSRGDWLMCLRGSNSPKSETYTLYFVGYDMVAAQRSVLVDRCDDQAYAPYALPPPEPEKGSPQIISTSSTRIAPTQIRAPQAGGSAVQATGSTPSGSTRLGEPLALTPR